MRLLKGWREVFAVETQLRGVRRNLLKAGATFLHQVQLGEDIGNDGVAPLGRNLEDIAVLNPGTVEHAARRIEFDAIVVDVHVDFTADLGHIPMNEVVHAAFQDGAVGVLREVEAIVREFEPAFRRAGLDEAGHHLEQVQQVAAILSVVDGVRLRESVPSGTKDT